MAETWILFAVSVAAIVVGLAGLRWVRRTLARREAVRVARRVMENYSHDPEVKRISAAMDKGPFTVTAVDPEPGDLEQGIVRFEITIKHPAPETSPSETS